MGKYCVKNYLRWIKIIYDTMYIIRSYKLFNEIIFLLIGYYLILLRYASRK